MKVLVILWAWCMGVLFLLWGCQQKTQRLSDKETQGIEYREIFTPEERKISPDILPKITEYYHRVWEEGNLWGSFLVAKGDSIIYENYRGYSDITHTQKIDANTPLHVASISKTLTAVAMMKLINAGKISLDTEVATLFKNFPYQGITIEHLLSQRSGLPKYEYFQQSIPKDAPIFQKEFWTNQDILNILTQYQPPLAKKTDTGFMYCNTNYALLALIIEKKTKKKFPEAMQKLIFEPLKMKHSFVFQAKDFATAARSFYQKNAQPYPYDQLDLIYGDKNLYTTPRDLHKFSMAMYSTAFLPSEWKQKMLKPYSMEKSGIKNYGLGVRLKVYDGGVVLPYHTGWWHGTNSVFGHLLDEKVTIVSIGNKFSKGYYSALGLASLFGNYPIEKMRYEHIMEQKNISPDTLSME